MYVTELHRGLDACAIGTDNTWRQQTKRPIRCSSNFCESPVRALSKVLAVTAGGLAYPFDGDWAVDRSTHVHERVRNIMLVLPQHAAIQYDREIVLPRQVYSVIC